MALFLALFSASIGLFLWMYLLTYLMYVWVSPAFFLQTRRAFLRGIGVALVFILFDTIPVLSAIIGHDWMVFPFLFLLISLPFSWRWQKMAIIIPLALWILLFFCAPFWYGSTLLWTPFHEEVGKWYQSITSTSPAMISPFVSLGFSFVENIRYYATELTWGQILGRNLFSLPLHIFAGLVVFWCSYSLWWNIRGTLCGIIVGVFLHTLYNWSLSSSLIVTILIMVAGYAFYGWSLEDGWWKKK